MGNTHLCTRSEEELIRIHSIGNCTPDERYPVEHHRGLLSVVEEQLIYDIDDDGKHEETGGVVANPQDLTCNQRSEIHHEAMATEYSV